MSADQKPRLLLADSSSLFRFFAAGVDIVEAVMHALGDRLYIVAEVEQEIRDHADDPEFRDGAAAFLELLENPPIVLPEDVRERLTTALQFNERFGKHRNEDKGETATALYARSRVKEGESWVVIAGDKLAEDLCNTGTPTVPLMNTTDTIAELVRQEALTVAEGERAWEAVQGPGTGRRLRARLRR